MFKMNTYSLSKLLNGHLYLTSLACHCCVNNKEIMVFKKEDEVLTSMPVNPTGIYPHMPIADHRETQKVYNTGRHRPVSYTHLTLPTNREV